MASTLRVHCWRAWRSLWDEWPSIGLLAIYGAMRRWSAQHFRATLQGYFLPASLVGITGYWLAGLWVTEVTHYSLLSLPFTIPAILLGTILNRSLRGRSFLKYVRVGLVLTGVALLIQAIRG